ncbi:flagellar protein FliT [Gracilibacillus caseinilyticus]|uniref:Flagellar protein FliT n=1 Tax=Gracilibacillus caseinilyticus TaxID=2932256 RepID=A0ABY4EV52_9BACI|nr:flagellar protein FliT [Gracilibacillus caseinilyticus]UOQ48293.1 flagellar protein FliT [Gracilibacillus caseinilyticus]
MNIVKELYRITQDIDQLLNQSIVQSNRADVLTNVQSLLDEREVLMKKLHTPVSNEDKELGQSLLLLDKQIQKRMNELFNKVKLDMKLVKKQKTSNQKYLNPYKNIANFDGTFLDKKK